MYNTLAAYLLEKNIQPSEKIIDLFSFIKVIEIYRLKDSMSIKEFCDKNKSSLPLYYYSGGHIISQGTKALLQDLGMDSNIESKIKQNYFAILDYILNNTSNNYFNNYVFSAQDGLLDNIVSGMQGW